MKVALIAVGVIVLIVVMLGMSVMGSRNEMVTQKEGIAAAFAQVDVALQRRAELIPNLVETVKGFAGQEKEVFANIANARAQMAGARTPGEKIAANSQMDGALGRLLVVSENYPQLRSSENFSRLMDELSGTENRINVERRIGCCFNIGGRALNEQANNFIGVRRVAIFKRGAIYPLAVNIIAERFAHVYP